MERYMYYCNKCGFLGSAEHKEPTDKQVCGNCHSDMKPLLMTSSQWHELSEEDKEQLKARLLSEAKATNEYDEDLHLRNKSIWNNNENKISLLIKFIAIGIYILGFITGIVNANSFTSNVFYNYYSPIWIMLTTWATAFVIGTLVWGFSEIIRLLDKINRKDK